MEHYSRDLNKSFPAFRACFKSEIAKGPTVKELTKMLIVENSTVRCASGEYITAQCLSLFYGFVGVSAHNKFV